MGNNELWGLSARARYFGARTPGMINPQLTWSVNDKSGNWRTV